MNKQYKLKTKNKYNGVNVDLSLKNDGYKIKPKNKVKYEGVTVNEMLVINQSFIEKLLKRKIGAKLNSYLQTIIVLLDDEDGEDTGAGKISEFITELGHYREVIKNNYKRYLDNKYIELLLKKIELLEYEAKKKLMQLNAYNYSKLQSLYEEEKEETRKRR